MLRQAVDHRADRRQSQRQACVTNKTCGDVQAHDNPRVGVHSRGVPVSAWQVRLGQTPSFVEGRRVTSDAELAVVAMALSQVNQGLVQAFVGQSLGAVGVMGTDTGQVRCVRVPDLGAVGVPQRLDKTLVSLLFCARHVL